MTPTRRPRGTRASLVLVLGVLVTLLLAPAGHGQGGRPRGDDGTGFRPLRFGDPQELVDAAPFFAGEHDTRVPPPEAVLGQAHGSRLARHDEIVDYMRRLAAASDRVTLRPHGRTHEGRPLLHVVITLPEHQARLDEILDGLGKLADPRGLDAAEAQRLVETSPAAAWMGYSIHGDELSGADASLAVAWHLASSTDPAVLELLREVVVVIDPCLNPDGRQRILTLVEQATGAVTNLDHASMQRGRWPWGRGNHYLFDMNRDWLTGSQPETRARWAAARRYHPQLFVDAHEMGALDTYLFYPQASPFNPHLPGRLAAWQKRFGDEQAAAFDAYGWPYYTREWADAWAPFYSDAWGSLGGAIGILYEQAGISGFPLELPSGRLRTYRETVHHQAVSSLANLNTLAANRQEILADYLAHKRAAVSAETEGNDRLFVLVAGRHPSRERDLVMDLLSQEIEVWQTSDHLQLGAATDGRGGRVDALDVPPGSYLVPVRQPMRARALSLLQFDVQIDEETLVKERRDLETKNETRLYDVTAWSAPLLADLEGWWTTGEPAGERLTRFAWPDAGLEATADGDADAAGGPVAWVVDGADDGAVSFAARAMTAGLQVAVSDKAFRSGGRAFSRGSLIVRRADNEGDIAGRVDAAADAAVVTAYATPSGRSPDDGPDLGGGHFLLLQRPRVGLVNNAPVASDVFGHLWHHLDQNVGVPVAHLDAQAFGWVDLRRYDVIVLPPGLGGCAPELSCPSPIPWVRRADLSPFDPSWGRFERAEPGKAFLISGISGEIWTVARDK